jgi:hypothetical protein
MLHGKGRQEHLGESPASKLRGLPFCTQELKGGLSATCVWGSKQDRPQTHFLPQP